MKAIMIDESFWKIIKRHCIDNNNKLMKHALFDCLNNDTKNKIERERDLEWFGGKLK